MPGITELLIILAIVALLFGTKKLRSMGEDMGGALKHFRKALRDDESTDTEKEAGNMAMNKMSEPTASEQKGNAHDNTKDA